ncbi:hypothetical protein FPZ12_028150 [Amycolatopsis acidicola]|uniref:DUF7144 domain-containing protein n=1 Tax=Amycolatopsis acidicola TaxID=2596893 RepID=A0A5N0UYM7_9PSEU|nr:hypothetical protein [Amycolatopsis acidicola]KAA9156200.1 hypothetical protein FPZ12_028150 [Amycolatopsis acidicola]
MVTPKAPLRGFSHRHEGVARRGGQLAGILLVVTGVLHLAVGLTAIRQPAFFAPKRDQLIDPGAVGWGWTHTALAVLLVIVGAGVLAKRVWAYGAGVLLVVLSILANFLFLAYYPVWSLLIIALDLLLVWSLLRELDVRTTVRGDDAGNRVG